MSFKLQKYTNPDFNKEPFSSWPDAKITLVEKDGVAPDNFHALSIYPEYFKIEGKWILVREGRMDCVPIVRPDGTIHAVEFRSIKAGDRAVEGRTEDGSEGIYVYTEGFSNEESKKEIFTFRSGRSRETAYTKDYNQLYELLKYERENGHILWVLGPAVVFDHNSRNAMSLLIEQGFAHAILAGNALATHDLEAGLLGTALGQNISSQQSMENSHYNHLDIINKARSAGSLEKLIDKENIKNGVIYSALKKNIPFVLAGSIRDDGPLPTVVENVYEAQDIMRQHIRKATTLICLATQLHTIAAGNMTPSYIERNGEIRPIYFYNVDVSEFAVNKLRDRGSLLVTTIVTNVQDFLVNLKSNLV